MGKGHVFPRKSGAHAKQASFRHRVACINRQIDQHLAQQTRVSHDPGRLVAECDRQFHVFADHHGEKRFCLVHQFIQVKQLGFDLLFSAEGQEVPGESGSPFRREGDISNVEAQGIVQVHVFLQQMGVAEDRGENIVEFVGNASGQLADRFHFLSLEQLGPKALFLLFRLFEIGNIEDNTDQAGRLALDVGIGGLGENYVAFRAVGMFQQGFISENTVIIRRIAGCSDRDFDKIDLVQVMGRTAGNLLLRFAEEAFKGLVAS